CCGRAVATLREDARGGGVVAHLEPVCAPAVVRNDGGPAVAPGTMDRAMPKCQLAVVSPFIDKRHGTERRVAECISRLADQYEIHVYSMRVEDMDLSKIVWHRIPLLPGPHLFNYLWW